MKSVEKVLTVCESNKKKIRNPDTEPPPPIMQVSNVELRQYLGT